MVALAGGAEVVAVKPAYAAPVTHAQGVAVAHSQASAAKVAGGKVANTGCMGRAVSRSSTWEAGANAKQEFMAGDP